VCDLAGLTLQGPGSEVVALERGVCPGRPAPADTDPEGSAPVPCSWSRWDARVARRALRPSTLRAQRSRQGRGLKMERRGALGRAQLGSAVSVLRTPAIGVVWWLVAGCGAADRPALRSLRAGSLRSLATTAAVVAAGSQGLTRWQWSVSAADARRSPAGYQRARSPPGAACGSRVVHMGTPPRTCCDGGPNGSGPGATAPRTSSLSLSSDRCGRNVAPHG